MNHNYDSHDLNKRSYFTKANIRILSFAVAMMLIGLGFFLSGISEKKRLQRETGAVYSRAFSELSTYICSIHSSLEKLPYITNPEQAAAVSADLFRQVGFAKSNLGQLPIRNADINNMQTFLAQTGDYIYSLTQQAIRENNINFSGETESNINMLINYSGKLAEQLVTMQDGINKANNSGAVLNIIENLSSENIPPLSESAELGDIEKIFADYPKLIYNGPFSSGKNDKPYEMIQGKKEISAAAAHEKAALFFGVSATRVKSKGLTESNLSTFNFELENKFIQVTQKGGYILNYFADRKVADQLMSNEDALRAAKKILSQVFPDSQFKETYYVTTDGVLTINFAAVQNNVILYPDLIKIGVALDNCEIIFYQANNYLKNHSLRDLPELDELTDVREAEKAVPQSLLINRFGVALIPSEYGDKSEVLCYEFTCENQDGREYIIYVDAETGVQEDALVIIDTGRGKLVT